MNLTPHETYFFSNSDGMDPEGVISVSFVPTDIYGIVNVFATVNLINSNML